MREKKHRNRADGHRVERTRGGHSDRHESVERKKRMKRCKNMVAGELNARTTGV